MSIKVSICCITYNQSKYIRKTIEGFLKQRTNFKFDVVIHDDASTDDTASIILEYSKKYPDIIKPIIQKENKYSLGGGIIEKYVFPYLTGEYIAFCEGDDYWTDENKLQKQVDILDSDSTIGLCYAKARKYEENTGEFGDVIGAEVKSLRSLIERNTIPTLTSLIRYDLYNKYIHEIRPSEHRWKMGDYPMWLWIYINSRIVFIDEIVGVYRVISNSASHSSNYIKQIEYTNSRKDIIETLLKNHPERDMLIGYANDIYLRSLSSCADNMIIESLQQLQYKKTSEIFRLLLKKTNRFIKDSFRRVLLWH